MIIGKDRKRLIALKESWRRAARGYFRSADMEGREFPRRFITHGGIIHANHVMALNRVLARPGWRERIRRVFGGCSSRPGRASGPEENAIVTASDLRYVIEHDPARGVTALVLIDRSGRMEMDGDWLDLLIKQLAVYTISSGGAS
jgi:hypothetical protein